ncbi:MAG: oxygen-independent coproporphyrinogen III oxidase [Hyphomicrobiaceae bacterium]
MATSQPSTWTDLALAERAVPRYTSYPTALQFKPDIGPATYVGWLAALPADASLSLYVHVPFCAEMCAYCGCHTKVVRRRAPIDRYLARLLAEIDLIADLTPARGIRRLHWGGGTPTTLGVDSMHEAVGRVARRFDLTRMGEHAVELDPRHVDGDIARGLAGMGVTRVSLGVQDLNPHVQQAIGRVQPFEVVARAVDALQGAGISGLNIDLMYGLPDQSVEDLQRSIARVLELTPSRIALFGYAHVPWFKTHQRLISESALPGAEARLAQARAALDAFTAAGYVPIGLDHFARPDDALAKAARSGRLHRNFQGYTDDDADAIIGLGASAIGRLPQGFVQNAPDFGGYFRAIDAARPATVRGYALTPEDILRGEAIAQLMCHGTVDLYELTAARGVDPAFFDRDLVKLDALAALGMVELGRRTVRVTEAGRPFLRLAAAAFDAHHAAPSRHARAV